jgi:hypothetical protein
MVLVKRYATLSLIFKQEKALQQQGLIFITLTYSANTVNAPPPGAALYFTSSA